MDDWSSLVAASAVAVVDRDLIECRLCSLVGLALIAIYKKIKQKKVPKRITKLMQRAEIFTNQMSLSSFIKWRKCCTCTQHVAAFVIFF